MLTSSRREDLRSVTAKWLCGSLDPVRGAVPGSAVLFGTMLREQRQSALLDPRRATLLVVGRVEASRVRRLAQATFGRWRSTTAGSGARRVRPARPSTQNVALYVPIPSASLVTLCAARPLADLTGDREAVELAGNVLGSGFGSRLHRRLRIERGLAYSSSTVRVTRRHSDAIVACTSVKSDDADEALRLVKGAIEGLASHPITEDEFVRAQRWAQTEHRPAVSMAETLRAWHQVIAYSAKPAAEMRKRLGSVSLHQVQGFAEKLADFDRWRVVLAGNPAGARAAAQHNGLRARAFR